MKKTIPVLIASLYFSNLLAQNINDEEEIKIQEVIVTSTRNERIQKEVPVTTVVVSSKTIENSKAIGIKELLERELPGITFSNHGDSSVINILGLDAKYILFLVDGERIAGETFDNIDYNRININDIERIEIVKGASSSLYGSNAIGGVINIITKKPKKQLDVNAIGRYGSFNEQNGSFFIGTKQEWGSVSLSSAYKSRDPYLLKDSSPMVQIYGNGNVKYGVLGETYISGYYDYGVNPKASINITPKIKLDLNTNLYFKERNKGDSDSKKVREQYADYSNSGKLNIQLGENQQLSVSGSYSIYEKFDNYLLLREKNKKYENSIWRASAIYNQKLLKKHTLILGGELFSEGLLSFMLNHTRKNAKTYSVFLHQEWELSDFFTLVTGTRYDYHLEHKGHFTWRLSGMYKAGEMFTMRGGYSGGFRSPTLKELYTDWYHPYGGGFQITGNTELKVEKSHNFSLSSDISIDDKLNVNIIGQYSYIKDKITSIWQGEKRDNLKYVNLEYAKIFSMEVLAAYRLKNNLLIKGGYSFTRNFNREQQFVRPHTITTRVEYTANFIKRYTPTISFSGKYLSGMDIYSSDFNSESYKVYYAPYFIGRLGLNVKLPLSFQAGLGIDNVFNYKSEFSGPYSNISAGRTFFVDLRWRLK